MTTVEILVPPPTYPVTVAELKANSRIASSLEDSLLASYVASATAMAEMVTGRLWIDQTVRQAVEAPYRTDCLALYRRPVLDVIGLEGRLEDGSWVAATDPYVVAGHVLRFPNRLTGSYEAVRATYRVGYLSLPASPTEDDLAQARAAVPAPVRAAILQIAAHLYENREGQGYETRYAAQVASIGATVLPPMAIEMLRPYVLWGV